MAISEHGVHDIFGGHMDTSLITVPLNRPRRRHSSEFKAQAIAACLQPGVSIAAIALANQLNANYLRRWVKAHRDQQATTALRKVAHESAKRAPSTTLVPITLRTPAPASTVNLQIEIHRPETTIHITWPVSQANACAQWLREILS